MPFCKVCISLAEVFNRFTFSASPKCTIDFFTKLLKEHRAECPALKVEDRLRDEDVQYGIAEESPIIDTYNKRTGGAITGSLHAIIGSLCHYSYKY